MLLKDENPWNRICLTEYLAHMASPNVGQVEMLNEIMRTQFELVPACERENATVAVLGVTDGNGLEHAERLGYGRMIGVDISAEYVEACKRKYAALGKRLEVCRLDLVSEREAAVQLLEGASLILADLLIEHIHLDRMILLLQALSPRYRYFSCVIQWNPDGEIASQSGHEQAFAEILPYADSVDRDDTIREMTTIGYCLTGHQEYELVNGKKLIRLDFETQAYENRTKSKS